MFHFEIVRLVKGSNLEYVQGLKTRQQLSEQVALDLVLLEPPSPMFEMQPIIGKESCSAFSLQF
jgi:hypothetical protein